jgi:TRAP-type mannitol/chloroaromatic compound transport system permease small subunit
MEKLLHQIIFGIEKISEMVGRAASWLTTLLVLLVCFDVMRRWLINDTEAWIMELEWHIFALIFLMGAAYSLKHDKHVRVDLFYASFSERDKAWVNLVGALIFLIPWCVIIVIFSWQYAAESLHIGESSPDPGGLPARYLIKFAIPLATFLLLLQGIAEILKAILILQKKEMAD